MIEQSTDAESESVLYIIDMFGDDEDKNIEVDAYAASTLTLRLSDTKTFLDVKSEIERLKGYPITDQRLLFLRTAGPTLKRPPAPLASFSDRHSLFETQLGSTPSFWLLKKIKILSLVGAQLQGFEDDGFAEGDESEGDEYLQE